MDNVPKTVLLGEDESFLSNILKVRLEGLGINVIQAFDGREALEKLKSSKVDLVLMDIILPKMSGFEVIQSIKSDPQYQSLPIIIISNLGQDSDVQKGMELGATEYYVKAKVPIDELVNRIKNFLEK